MQKSVYVRVKDEECWRRLEEYAKDEGVAVSIVVMKAIREFLEKERDV